jgi:hypothetical protein
VSFVSAQADDALTTTGQSEVAYLRQKGNKIYMFISSIHSNANEPDRHPVLYLAILAAPDAE